MKNKDGEWRLGDCGCSPDPGADPWPDLEPKTGQVKKNCAAGVDIYEIKTYSVQWLMSLMV